MAKVIPFEPSEKIKERRMQEAEKRHLEYLYKITRGWQDILQIPEILEMWENGWIDGF